MSKLFNSIYVKTISISLLFGLLFWVIDGYFEFIYFHKNLSFMLLEGPESLFEALFTRVPVHSIFVRVSFIIASLVGGILISLFLYNRQVAQNELKKSESRFRAYFENSPAGIYETDSEGKYIQINRKWSQMTGLSIEKAKGNGWQDALHPDDKSDIFNKWKQHAKSEEPWNHEYRFVNSSTQTEIWVTGTATALLNEHGEITGYLGVNIDITDRKKAEKELEIESQRRRLLFNKSPDGVLIVNPKTAGFVEFNTAAHKQLGYTREEFSKLTIFDLEAQESPEDIKNRIASVVQEGRVDFETLQRTKQGEIRNVHVTAQLVEIMGNDVYHCVWRDITKRKKAEEEKTHLERQLRQAYKMEAIGTMAGGIAHDFNNILFIILGNADMAKDYIPDGNPANYNIDQVLIAANRAKDLVRQILTFSRDTEHTLLPVNPSQVIKDSLKLIRSTTPTTVDIVQDISRKNCKILADSTQLHQLLMNLYSNAIHAMDEKGKLDVNAEVVNLDLATVQAHPGLNPGKHLKIKVSDTGVGMDKNTQDRIFDPFFTTKDVNEGTGMGLSIVLGIVKSHNGYIEIDSSPGIGTTFSLYFPTLDEFQDQERDTMPGEIPKGNERILFIDDEEMLAELGSKILERQGYTVTTKTSSQDALDTFKLSPDAFDLVVTDQSMPKMTGSELAVELLKLNPNIPIILCTGFSKKISEGTAKKLGIRDFCFKPMDRKSLSQVVRKVFDENKIS